MEGLGLSQLLLVRIVVQDYVCSCHPKRVTSSGQSIEPRKSDAGRGI